MKPTFILCLIVAILAISCEKEDEFTSNLTDIDTKTGLYDLYLYNVKKNMTTRITSSPEQTEHSYTFAPDSKKILYVNKEGINEMNVDGSENKVLIATGGTPSYSPDGTQITFVEAEKLYKMNVTGTGKTLIADRISLWYPIWSNDGENIVCSSNDGLCIVTLDGEINVFSSGNSADWYDWSNDSKEIYYSKFVSYKSAQIFKYDIIAKQESQLTSNEKYNYSPKCNPVKDEILFTSLHANYGGDLILSNPDNSDDKIIFHKDHIESPCWSPDGKRIVFITENSNVAIVDKDGKNYKIINEITGACMEPKWSPDGKYILYYRALFSI